jgi:hypothetical protein
MNTETKNLAALVQLALQKNTFIPVSSAEIKAALNALTTALDIFPYYNQYTHDVNANLCQSSDVLSGLFYLISTHTLLIKNGNHQTLLENISDLHKKVNLYLKQYSNPEILPYDLLSVSSLLNILADIDDDLKLNTSILKLYELIKPHLLQIQSSKTMHYHQWLWWSKFAACCKSAAMDLPSFRDILIRLNFNLPCFVDWLSENFIQQIEASSTMSEKLQLVISQILKYRNLNKIANGYIPAERSVKHAIITICKARLLYLTKQPLTESNVSNTALQKINTVLSVPQLALFVRLMVETKLLNETNQSAVLKNVAAVVFTSKTNAISFESLRVNYYTPNLATKNIVKEYLLQMIRLVNSY